jgi:hypothetical protein
MRATQAKIVATSPIRIAGPVRERLFEIKLQLEAERQRRVTVSETLEALIDRYESARALEAMAAQEAGR